jgi:polyphosphate glucokinase
MVSLSALQQDNMSPTQILGVDIGGSGMKAAIVDPSAGTMVTERHRIPTPKPATSESMANVFHELVAHFEWTRPIGCTFPGVVRNQSIIETAANLDSSWVGVDAASLFGTTHVPVTMINDADAAGLAEMRVGAGKGREGVVFMLTIGTGFGTAIFHDGRLLPNIELGHIEIDGVDAEELATSRAKKAEGLSITEWAVPLERYLHRIEDMISPDLFIIGGGISKSFDEFAPLLHTRAELVPAQLRNHAGIVGAALAAV